MDTDSLLNKPYGDRQFIVVVEDPEGKKEDREWWKTVADHLDEVGDAMRFGVGMPTGLLADYLTKKAAERIREAHNLNIPVLPVPASITSELDLPPGHPRNDLLYVAHPSNTQAYLPFASFHRLTFESKFSEAISLLTHLGASEIHVEHVHGWGRDLAGNLSVDVEKADLESPNETEGSTETSRQFLYDAELPGHADPSLPDDGVWYPHEPTWQSVAESRIDYDLSEFSLKLEYTDDFDVTADLAAKAKKAGFSLGGSFESHESTTWLIEGTFEN